MDACTEYIGFDDRKMIVIGILLISIITHPILMDIPYLEFITSPLEILESILWTTTYWIILRAMMIYLRRKYPGIAQNPKRIFLGVFFVIILAPILSKFIGKACIILFGMDPDISRPLKYTLIYILAFGIMAVYEASYYFYQYKMAIEETEKLKTAQIQSQLENLKNQISPHFLFNSLNTLMNLIPKDQNRAMTYLSKLSKFYRYTVSNQDEALVLVSTEVENAKNFNESCENIEWGSDHDFEESSWLEFVSDPPAHFADWVVVSLLIAYQFLGIFCNKNLSKKA